MRELVRLRRVDVRRQRRSTSRRSARRNASPNNTESAAPTSSCTFGTDHYVNIHLTTAAFTANVGKAFQNPPPKIALLTTDTNNHTGTINDGILEGYLQNAGLDFQGAGGCAAVPANTANCPQFTTNLCSGGPNNNATCNVTADCGTTVTTYTCSFVSGGKTYCSNNHASRCDNQASPATYCGSHTTTYSCVGTTGYSIQSGQIYDAFDIDDLSTQLVASKYTMVWTPHWQTNSTLSSQETSGFTAIKTFLAGQTGLAAECASISSYEGASFTGGESTWTNNNDAMQLQTCAGTGTTCSGTLSEGVSGNPIAPYGTINSATSRTIPLDNCSNPGTASSTACSYFSYPGDSFAQIGDFRWDAQGGWVTGFLPRTAAGAIYSKSVVPLISMSTLTAANKSTLRGSPGRVRRCDQRRLPQRDRHARART